MSKHPKEPEEPSSPPPPGAKSSPVPPLVIVRKKTTSKQNLTTMSTLSASSGPASPPAEAPIAFNPSLSPTSPSVLAAGKDMTSIGKMAASPPPNTLTGRNGRSTHKSKSRDIVKPSPAVYESSDGPLLRATLPEILRIFQVKISDTNASSSEQLLVEQVMITHLYWTTTPVILKCFASAILKVQSGNNDEPSQAYMVMRVCNWFKTFLLYFDVSPYEAAVEEILAALKTVHPTITPVVTTLVSNNAAAFGHSTVGKPSGAWQPSGVPSQAGSTASGVSIGGRDVTGAGMTHSGSASKLETAEADGPKRDSVDASRRNPTPSQTRESRVRRDSGDIDTIRLSVSDLTSSKDSSNTPSRARKSPQTSPAQAPLSLPMPSPISLPPISATSIGDAEMPDLVQLANQMALVDWTVFSHCTITDFMNASYLKLNKPVQNPSGAVGSGSSPSSTTASSNSTANNASWGQQSSGSLGASGASSGAGDDHSSRDGPHASTIPSTLVSGSSFSAMMTAAGPEGLPSLAASTAAVMASLGSIPNSVARYIEHTNLTTRWIASKILSTRSARARGKLVGYFIRLMEELKDRQDYTGMMNVFTTLNTNSIWKIRKSWKNVDSKRQKAFAKFEAIIKPMANFGGYRDLLSKSKPPAVPALAIVTKDLVAIEEMPTYIEDEDGNSTNFLNWMKFAQLAAVFSEQVLRFTKNSYNTVAEPRLFDELMNPAIIESGSRDAVSGSSPSSSSSASVSTFLMTEEEIITIADRIDMEEQGLSATTVAASIASISTTSTTLTASNAAEASILSGRKPTSLSLYLVPSTQTGVTSPGRSPGSSPPSSTRRNQGSVSRSGSGNLTPNAGSSAPPSPRITSLLNAAASPSFLVSMEDNLDHVASITLLRRLLTISLFSSHTVTEGLSDAQRHAYENQTTIQQTDCYVRMLRYLDISVKHANAAVHGTLSTLMGIFAPQSPNATTPSASNNPPGTSLSSPSTPAPMLKNTKPGGITTSGSSANLASSDSGSGNALLSPSNTAWLAYQWTGVGLPPVPFDEMDRSCKSEIDKLELPCPTTHLLEVLSESVRMFQRFDGVTKFKNMIRSAQLQSTLGIGHSLLLENRGVLAFMDLPSRTIINAFLATACCCFGPSLHATISHSSTTPTNPAPAPTHSEPKLFVGSATSIDRIGISLQLAVSDSESCLPKGASIMPSAGLGAQGRVYAQRLLSLLPPAIAELFLPFESMIASTSSSVAWFPKDDVKSEAKETKDGVKEKKSSKKDLAAEDDLSEPGSPQLHGALVLSLTLPLGSYAETLTNVSGQQKRFLASKLTALLVKQWKVEHVVSWLFLTGMSAWCSKFEQQSVSGAELADLDLSDLESMNVRASSSQSSSTLMKSIKLLVRAAQWDGVISGDTGEEYDERPSSGHSHPHSSASNSNNEEIDDDDDDERYGGATDDSTASKRSRDDEEIGSDEESSDDVLIGHNSKSKSKKQQRSGSALNVDTPSKTNSLRGSVPRSGSMGNSIATGSANASSAALPPGAASNSASSSPATPVRRGRQSPSGSFISPPSTQRRRGNVVRMRVLEGTKAGILNFASIGEFTLTSFFAKASAFFKASVPYSEDTHSLTYYDIDGETFDMGAQFSFARLADTVWTELQGDGAIDIVYACIEPKNASLNPGSVSVDRAIANFASTVSAHLNASSSSIASTGSSSSLPVAAAQSPLSSSMVAVDYSTKYKGVNASSAVLVCSESGRIVFATDACSSLITKEKLVSRKIDQIAASTFHELLTKSEASLDQSGAVELIATDFGVLTCTFKITPISGTAPIHYECLLELEPSIPRPESSPKAVDLPKLRESASKSTAAVVIFSQQYGLIQFANKAACAMIGSETLQGVKVAGLLQFGVPTTPGEHQVPLQKKDSGLSVVNFIMRLHSTQTDTIVTLSSPAASR